MENNDISELVQVMKEIRDCLVQLVDIKHKEDEISFIQRKDIKSIFNCTDTTVAKILNKHNDKNTLIVHRTIKNIIIEIKLKLITKFNPYVVK